MVGLPVYRLHRDVTSIMLRRFVLPSHALVRRLSSDKAGIAQLPAVDECVQKVASTFRNHFVSKLTKPRTIGREVSQLYSTV